MRAFFRVVGEILSHPQAAARDPFLRIVVGVIVAVVLLFVLLAVSK
jgi:hypothetical protein